MQVVCPLGELLDVFLLKYEWAWVGYFLPCSQDSDDAIRDEGFFFSEFAAHESNHIIKDITAKLLKNMTARVRKSLLTNSFQSKSMRGS